MRAELAEGDIEACMLSRTRPKEPIPHDAVLYKQRHKTTIMYGRLEGWWRVATRYDHIFFSAICIAATVTFSMIKES